MPVFTEFKNSLPTHPGFPGVMRNDAYCSSKFIIHPCWCQKAYSQILLSFAFRTNYSKDLIKLTDL
jgi:hypothetical protein